MVGRKNGSEGRQDYEGIEFQHSHGLSVYFPWSRSASVELDQEPYQQLAFGAESGWAEFLAAYLESTQARASDHRQVAAGMPPIFGLDSEDAKRKHHTLHPAHRNAPNSGRKCAEQWPQCTEQRQDARPAYRYAARQHEEPATISVPESPYPLAGSKEQWSLVVQGRSQALADTGLRRARANALRRDRDAGLRLRMIERDRHTAVSTPRNPEGRVCDEDLRGRVDAVDRSGPLFCCGKSMRGSVRLRRRMKYCRRWSTRASLEPSRVMLRTRIGLSFARMTM